MCYVLATWTSTVYPRESLRRLHKRGLLRRVSRGLYVLPNADITEHHTLAQAGKRVPQGVI